MVEPANNYKKLLWIKRIITLVLGLVIWYLPIPWDITTDAWHLFAIFMTAIIGVLLEAFSIFTASVIGLVAVVLLRVLTPEIAFSGFSESFILLILAAFLVAKGVIKSGLGRRIAFLLIRRFGQSTLNLGYCLVVTDTIIGPSIPSNTGSIWNYVSHNACLVSGHRISAYSRREKANRNLFNDDIHSRSNNQFGTMVNRYGGQSGRCRNCSSVWRNHEFWKLGLCGIGSLYHRAYCYSHRII